MPNHTRFAVVATYCLVISVSPALLADEAPLRPPQPLIEAKTLIEQAGQTDNHQQRSELLGRSEKLLSDLLSEYGDTLSDLDQRQQWRLQARCELVLTIPMVRAQSHAQKVIFLQAGEDDRQALKDITQAAIDQSARLTEDIDKILLAWRANLEMLVTEAAELENLRRVIDYKLACITAYLGLAQQDNPDWRRSRLEESLRLVGPFAGQGFNQPTRAWAKILTGLACWGLGEYSNSVEALAEASALVEGQSINYALFALALAQIDHAVALGKSDQAAGGKALDHDAWPALQTYQTSGSRSGTGELAVKINSAILEERFYLGLADLAEDSTKHEQAVLASRRALVLFCHENSQVDVQREFLAMLARRDGQKEKTTSDSLDLLAKSAQAATSDSTDTAIDLLKSVISTDDPLTAQTRPIAMWQMGHLLEERGDHCQAGAVLDALAREYPDGAFGFQAVRSATRCYHNAVADFAAEQKKIPQAILDRHIELLVLLLNRWGDQPAAEQWRFELGLAYEQAAKSADSDKKRQELTGLAIDAFERTPESASFFTEAIFRSLDLQARSLTQTDASSEQVRRLAKRLEEFADFLDRRSIEGPGEQQVDWYRQRAAIIRLRHAQLLVKSSVHAEGTAELVDSIIRNYPDTPAAGLAGQMQIQRLLEQDQTLAAIQRFVELQSQYPAELGQISLQVAEEVYRQIENARQDTPGGGRDDLSILTKMYHRLASSLYEPLAKTDISDRYHQTQLMARAFLETNQPAQAIELFEECHRYDLARNGKNSASSALDAANIWGLAAANRDLGRYEQALRYYRELIDGLDRSRHEQAYWRAELEYCRCVLSVGPAQPAALRNLAVRIRQLRMEDPAMGGHAEAFRDIEDRAQILGSAPHGN